MHGESNALLVESCPIGRCAPGPLSNEEGRISWRRSPSRARQLQHFLIRPFATFLRQEEDARNYRRQIDADDAKLREAQGIIKDMKDRELVKEQAAVLKREQMETLIKRLMEDCELFSQEKAELEDENEELRKELGLEDEEEA